MLVRRANMVEVECVARGYISGSGWKDYRREGNICGIPLPTGLRESDRLPEPVFTPATKAQSGHHDENISFETASKQIGADLAGQLRKLTLDVYTRAAGYAETRGIIIADTKFEFGFIHGELVLADEVLTPDSSRFWPRASYQPGGPQASYDKQYVRDYPGIDSLEQAASCAGAAGRRGGAHQRKISRGLSRTHRKAALSWIDILLVLVVGLSVVSGFAAGFAGLASASSPRWWDFSWVSGVMESPELTLWIT